MTIVIGRTMLDWQKSPFSLSGVSFPVPGCLFVCYPVPYLRSFFDHFQHIFVYVPPLGLVLMA